MTLFKDKMPGPQIRFSLAFHRQTQPDLDQFYKPGDTVPASGIYAVCHTKEHSGLQEVVLLANHVIPQCEICQETLHYQLVRTVPYISEDPDFSADEGL